MLYHDIVFLRLRDFLSRPRILCRDRFCYGKEKLCRHIIVYVATKLAKGGKFLSRRNVIMLQHSCPTWGEFMSEQKISGHKVSM